MEAITCRDHLICRLSARFKMLFGTMKSKARHNDIPNRVACGWRVADRVLRRTKRFNAACRHATDGVDCRNWRPGVFLVAVDVFRGLRVFQVVLIDMSSHRRGRRIRCGCIRFCSLSPKRLVKVWCGNSQHSGGFSNTKDPKRWTWNL